MGLNMPAKTVVFTSVKKWDGDSHRYIGSGEYIQVSSSIFSKTSVFYLFPSMPVDIYAFLADEWQSWTSW